MNTDSKNNSLFYILLGSLAFGAACLIGQHIAPETPQLSANTASHETYTNYIENLETQTWDHIETTTGVKQSDCQSFISDNAEYFAEGAQHYREQIADYNQTLSSETIKLIHSVCKECDVDIQKIDLICYKGKGSPACADDYTLYINSSFFNSLPTEAKKFVVAHELTHHKQKDNSYENALSNLTDTNNESHVLMRGSYTQFIEWRADITALLTGPEYCKGGIAFFNELIIRYGDKKSATHPLTSERLQMAQNIYAMHANI